MQLGVGPHFLSHVAAERRNAPPPLNRHVSRLSHTDSQTLAVLPLHFPLQLEHHQECCTCHLFNLNQPSFGKDGQRMEKSCTFQKMLPSDTYFVFIQNRLSDGPLHWQGLEDSLCEWHKGGWCPQLCVVHHHHHHHQFHGRNTCYCD